MINWSLSSSLYVLFFPRRKKSTKRTPLKRERVSFRKKRTCRIFLHSTSSPLKKPLTCVRSPLRCAHERGLVNRLKGILFPVLRTVAVISFEMKLKVSLCYMSWVQHYLGTNTTVRAFFRLRKKPNLLLCAPFSGKVLCRAFFQESSPPEARILPDKSKFKKLSSGIQKGE